MSKLKVSGNASGTGVITLEAPNTNTDRAITLPDSAGELINIAPSTSGNVLTSDGTDWTSAAAGGGGLYASVAIIGDVKANDTVSGTFTSGAWRTRDLNTEVSDADGIVSISSNQFTLAAGTYTVEWYCPTFKVDESISRLQDTTNTISYYSSNSFTSSAVSASGSVIGMQTLTIASSAIFEIDHYCLVTKGTNGFGSGYSALLPGTSTYTLVKILKHS